MVPDLGVVVFGVLRSTCSQWLSHDIGSPTSSNFGNSILCKVLAPSQSWSVSLFIPRCRPLSCGRPPGGGGTTEAFPMVRSDDLGGLGACNTEASSPGPDTCCSRWMSETSRAVYCALMSRRSFVTARTSSSNRSRCWTTLSMGCPVSFPELVPVAGGMVEQPGLVDTKMSRARALTRYGRTLDRRLYLLRTGRGLDLVGAEEPSRHCAGEAGFYLTRNVAKPDTIRSLN
jgi:hypothetical protein